MNMCNKLMGPLRIGYESAKANLVPMVVLWLVAAATSVGYYALPGFAGLLEPLAEWQRTNGSPAAFASLAVYCGIVPGLFMCAIKSLRPRHPLATVVLLSLWAGLWGVVNNGMYTFLDGWIGSGNDFSTLLRKTAFDEFVWTVFVSAPCHSVFYFWVGRDFSFSRTRAEWPSSYVYDVYLPYLLSNWAVWLPVLFAIYSFPLPLQIQLAGLSSSFFALMCLQIGRRSAVSEPKEG